MTVAAALFTPAGDFASMLMDDKLPGRDGLSLQQTMRRDPEFANLRAVVFSTRAHPKDRDVFDDSGANADRVKDVQHLRSPQTRQVIVGYWLNRVSRPQAVATPCR